MRELSNIEIVHVCAGEMTCTFGPAAEPCSGPGWKSALDSIAEWVTKALEKLEDWFGC